MVVSISVYSSLCIGNIFKADETVVQVLKEDGKPATSQSRMWLYARRKWREAMPEGATVKTSSKCSITTRVQIRQAPDWEPA